jgi:membrane protein implicated in regulation of membrane protease activity
LLLHLLMLILLGLLLLLLKLLHLRMLLLWAAAECAFLCQVCQKQLACCSWRCWHSSSTSTSSSSSCPWA